MEYIRGLDLNHYRPFTKFVELYGLGYRFLINKATEGTWFTDKTFTPHELGAKAAGFPFGGYHYWRMNEDPKLQAKKFFSVAGGHVDFPPMVDVEGYNNGGYSKLNYQNHLQSLLYEVASLFNREPIIYTAYYFWRDNIGAPTWSRNYKLWDANYVNNYLTAKPLIPPNWLDWTFWQYTASEPVLGYTYDSNVFKGTLNDLLILANKPTIPPPPTLEEKLTKLDAQLEGLEERVERLEGMLLP